MLPRRAGAIKGSVCKSANGLMAIASSSSANSSSSSPLPSSRPFSSSSSRSERLPTDTIHDFPSWQVDPNVKPIIPSHLPSLASGYTRSSPWLPPRRLKPFPTYGPELRPHLTKMPWKSYKQPKHSWKSVDDWNRMLRATIFGHGEGKVDLKTGLAIVGEMRAKQVKTNDETLRILVDAVEMEKSMLEGEAEPEFAFDGEMITSFETVEKPPIVPSLPFDQVVDEQARIDTLISNIESDLSVLPSKFETMLSDLSAFPRLRHLISKHHLEQDTAYIRAHSDQFVSQRIELADQEIAAAEAQFGQGSREAIAVGKQLEETFRQWETGGDERTDEFKGQDFMRAFANHKAFQRENDRKVVDDLIRKRKVAVEKVSRTLRNLEKQAEELPKALETAKEYLRDLHLATILTSDTSFNPSLASTIKQAQADYQQQRSASSSTSPSSSALSSLGNEARIISHLRQFISTHISPLERATKLRVSESTWRQLIGRLLVTFSPGATTWADNFKWSFRLYQARNASTPGPARSLAIPTLEALHQTVAAEPNHPEVGGIALRIATDILSNLIRSHGGSSLRPQMEHFNPGNAAPTAYDFRPLPPIQERMRPILAVMAQLEGVFVHAKVPEGSKVETLEALLNVRQMLATENLFIFEDGQGGERDVYGKQLRHIVDDLQSTLSTRIDQLEKEGVRVPARDEERMTDSEGVIAAERLEV